MGRRRAGGPSPAHWLPSHPIVPQGERWSPSPAGRSGTLDSTTATGPATASATSSRSTNVGAAAPAPAQGTRAELRGTGTRTGAHLGLLIAQLSLLLRAGVPHLQGAAVLAMVPRSLTGWSHGPCWDDPMVLARVAPWSLLRWLHGPCCGGSQSLLGWPHGACWGGHVVLASETPWSLPGCPCSTRCPQEL